MAHKIVWAPEAVDDLTEIRDYIARDSENYAAGMVERILEAVERLPGFPLLGRHVPETDNDAIRELIVEPYRVIYRAGKESADIVAVIHGGRDLPQALANRHI